MGTNQNPTHCACGANFNLTHALHCAKGGYTHIRHNEIRDTFANLMNEVCHDVEIEPKLQPLQGESFVNNSTTTEDEARLDIKANRLRGSQFSRAFFDVKIFKPHAKTLRKLHKDAHKNHETLKNSNYQQRHSTRMEKMQSLQISSFSSEPSELVILKD